MRRGLVRTLWGNCDRTKKIRMEVALARTLPQLEPTKVFCWGYDNCEFATNLGWDCVLVDDQPYCFPEADIFKDGEIKMGKFWKHKLIALDMAASLFEEFIMCDWDLTPNGNMPTDFWERFYAKESFQGLLYVYHRRQLNWKLTDMRKIMSACFLYCRDKTAPKKLLEISEENPTWREELCLTFYCDQVLGHFPHTDDQIHNSRAFCDKHEAWCAWVPNGMAQTLGIKKDPCFIMRNTTRGNRIMA